MALYKVLNTHIQHNGALYAPGDTMELTDTEAAALAVELLPEREQEPATERRRLSEGRARK